MSASLTRRDFLGQSAALIASGGLLAALTSPASAQLPKAGGALGASETYTLVPLPYGYADLEPIIDEETMRLHHDVHFMNYVKGLNEALVALENARAAADYSTLSYWENQLAFHGAGYVLHTLFFEQMTAPNTSGTADNSLRALLSIHFGSLEAFQAQFSAAANQVQGSGWAILAYQPLGSKLVILQAEKHQNLSQWNVTPLLALDVWEHAYYLNYKNRCADYVKAWWGVVNWNSLGKRVQQALL